MVIVTASCPVHAQEQKFKADLKSNSIIPRALKNIKASGTAEFMIVQNATATTTAESIPDINYTIKVNGISRDNVSAISINKGHSGENGPRVYLFPNSTLTIQPTGILLATGKIDPLKLEGPFNKGKYSSLLLSETISKGDTYVIIRTAQNPHGEIRGQILKLNIIQ